MRLSLHKLLSVAVLLLACRAQAFFPEHVWLVGSPTNCYGLSQWDEFDRLGGVPGQKRTVIYLGSHQWVVRQPASLVVGAGVVGVVCLSMLGAQTVSKLRHHPEHEERIS
jgi:hypothetical protein